MEYNLETGLVISMLLQLTSFKLVGNLYARKNAQVVTNLQTSCNKYVEKLLTCCVRTACLVPSFSEQLWNKLLATCNKLDGTTSLLQGCSNKTDTVMIYNNIVTTLCCQLCDNLVTTGLYQSSFEKNLVSSLST